MTVQFSIITVTKNNLEGLKRTHKSLGAQTYRNYEWIVVDGDSQDGTKNYLATSRAIWISEPDKGIYDGMNKAIPETRGEYVMFLNAGDMLAGPWVLDRIVRALNEHRKAPDFVYGDSHETRPGLPPSTKKARSHRQYRRGMFTHHQAMLYRRERLRKLKYRINYRIASDYELTCRFLRQKKIRTRYIPLALCIYESGGLSQKMAELGRREQALIRKRLRLCNPIMNFLITSQQKMAWRLRQKYPRLYHTFKAIKV